MTKIRQFITGLFETTKEKITELAKTELENTSKKEILDERITQWISSSIEVLSINPFIKWVIKRYIFPNVCIITQAIYDLIKLKIAGVTIDCEI